MIDYRWIGPLIFFLASLLMSTGCKQPDPTINVYETSKSGHKLTLIEAIDPLKVPSEINLN